MTEFIVLYYAPKDLQDKCKNMSPDEMSKMIESWKKWGESCGEHMVDAGSMLINGKHIVTTGSTQSSSEIWGQSTMQADNVSKIEELLKKSPDLEWDGCYIEIHEKMPYPQ